MELLHPLALPGGRILGVGVLQEIGGEHGGLLFDLLRAVLSWSAHPETGTTSDAAALERIERELLARGENPLASPCALLAGYMARCSADQGHEVAWLCICISDWALSGHFRRTGAEFAKAAALAAPRNARYAWAAARMLRRYRRWREAEHWFERAHRVAVWTDDYECQVNAVLDLAAMYARVGTAPQAVSLYEKALRVADRHRLVELKERATKRKAALLSRPASLPARRRPRASDRLAA